MNVKAVKKCPMRFCMPFDPMDVASSGEGYGTGGGYQGGSIDECETDSCAWWHKDLKECYVATVGRFAKSIRDEIGNVSTGVRELSIKDLLP